MSTKPTALGSEPLVPLFYNKNTDGFRKGSPVRSIPLSSLLPDGFVPASLGIGSEDSELGTDATAIVQAALNQADGVHPFHLLVDVPYRTQGNDVKSNTFVEFVAGCGAKLVAGSNRSVLGVNLQNTAVGLAKRYKDITVRGGIFHANNFAPDGTQRQTGYSSAHPEKFLPTCLNFAGVENLHVEDCTLLCARQFAFHGWNISRGRFRNITINSAKPVGVDNAGFDGLHFNGGITDLLVDGTILAGTGGGDDGIALNANEVASPSEVIAYVGGVITGPINNVTIRNTTFRNHSGYGIRILSSTYRVDRILIDGVYGSTTTYWMVCDNLTSQNVLDAAGNGNVGDVVCRNIDVAISTSEQARNANCVISCNVDRFVIDTVNKTEFTAAYPVVKVQTPGNIKFLSINGLVARNTSNAYYNTPLLHIESGEVYNLHLNGAYLNGVNTFVKNEGSLFMVQGVNVNQYNTNTSGTIVTTSAIQNVTLSNYLGTTPLIGQVVNTAGDAFPPVLVQPILYDTFSTDGDIADLVPAPVGVNPWFKYGLSSPIISTNGRVSMPSGSVSKYYNEVGKVDVDLRVNVYTPGSNTELILCYTDENSYVQFNVLSGAVYAVINNVAALIVAGSGATLDGNSMRVVKSGNTFRTYRNGVLLGTGNYTATTLAGTQVGLFYFNDAMTQLDNFMVYEATAAQATPVMYDTFSTDGDIGGKTPSPTGSAQWAKYGFSSPVVSSGGRISMPSGTLSKYYYPLGKRDVDISVSVFTPGSNVEVIFSYTDENSYIQFNVITGSVDAIINDVATNIVPASGTTASGNTMRVKREGNTITAYRNATQVGTGTLGVAVEGTQIGLLFYQDNTTHIDNYKVF